MKLTVHDVAICWLRFVEGVELCVSAALKFVF